jgi:hypothetical protein
MPFHAVRMRFLGEIANPGISSSPIDAVKALWRGAFLSSTARCCHRAVASLAAVDRDAK